MSDVVVYQDGCRNESKTAILKFFFTITNFSMRRGQVKSSSFPSSAPGNVGKWYLYTDGINNNEVLIYIKQETTTVISTNVELSLINGKGGVVKDYVVQYNSGSSCYVNLGYRDFLLDKANDLLPNDELTIVCKIKIILSSENCSHAILPTKFILPPCQLVEDLGNLLSSKILSDVTIAVGEAELRAHKAVLAARSAVFAAMFTNQMLEKETSIVEVADMDAEVFLAMLEFMYTGKVISLKNKAHDLLAAANKYQLQGLKSMCEEALSKALSLDNVLENLALADIHNAPRLKERCISFVKKCKDEILRTSSWNNLKRSLEHSLLIEILEKTTFL